MQIQNYNENPVQRVERVTKGILSNYSVINDPSVRADVKIADAKALVDRFKQFIEMVANSAYEDNREVLAQMQGVLNQTASGLESKLDDEEEFVRGASDLIKKTAHTIGISAKMKALKQGNLGDYEIDEQAILKYLAENGDPTQYINGGGKNE
ncbi:MAG: hypothetical protein Q8R00_00195 [Candidatus Nanoarchaeia archaeon]|nr:hypothetical protein [Candidatus Nanoarchaeia archaeon]